VDQESFRIEGVQELSNNFAKQVKKLAKRSQSQLSSVVDELIEGRLPPGRHLEKLRGFNDLYSVRLNKNQRLIFRLNPDGTITLTAVGGHKKVYKN